MRKGSTRGASMHNTRQLFYCLHSNQCLCPLDYSLAKATIVRRWTKPTRYGNCEDARPRKASARALWKEKHKKHRPNTKITSPLPSIDICTLRHTMSQKMQYNSYPNARLCTNSSMPAPADPLRFRPKMLKQNDPNILYSTPRYDLAPSYYVMTNVPKPYASPVTPRSDPTTFVHSYGSSPTSSISSLPSSTTCSVASLLNELEPGPITSLFYNLPRKPMPTSFTDTPFFLPCSHLRTDGDSYGSIWAFGRTGYGTNDQIASSLLRRQGLEDLRRRLIRENITNGRGGNSSLSTTLKNIEEATAHCRTGSSAFIDILGMFLNELIRDFSPRYTPDEILPYITHWVELKKTQEEVKRKIEEMKERAMKGPKGKPVEVKKENRKLDRSIVFAPLRAILTQIIMDIWQPAVSSVLLLPQ